jgi:hypothetical protein
VPYLVHVRAQKAFGRDRSDASRTEGAIGTHGQGQRPTGRQRVVIAQWVRSDPLGGLIGTRERIRTH